MTTDDLTALDMERAREPLALLGFLHEAGEYDRMGEVFTDDIDFKNPAGLNVDNLEDLIAEMRKSHKALSHHVTNVLVDHKWDDNGGVTVRAKSLTVRTDGSIRVAETTDYVVKTPLGWRIAKRRVQPVSSYP